MKRILKKWLGFDELENKIKDHEKKIEMLHKQAGNNLWITADRIKANSITARHFPMMERNPE